MEESIGELKARKVPDYVPREVGPSTYNQALADAQRSLEQAVADLPGTRFEPEFAYRKRR